MDAATRRAEKLRAKGKEVDFPKLLEMEPDSGTTNVRNTASAHWRPWLKPENRCLVPFTAFSEPGRDAEGRYRPVWFRMAGDDPEPLAFFAGIHVMDWTCVRKIPTPTRRMTDAATNIAVIERQPRSVLVDMSGR